MTDPELTSFKAADNNATSGSDSQFAATARAQVAGIDSGSRLARLATSTTVRRQRRVWSTRVNSWDHHTPAGLEKVTAAVLATVTAGPGDKVLDLGCGTGQLSLPLAERGASVLAIDVSAGMIERLAEKAEERSLPNLEGLATPVEDLSLPEGSIDLIVTSYALHHLRDPDKARLVSTAYTWLRPGGTLVVADMMFGRGGTSQDRAIIKSKVSALARRGVGGWWRIAKNSYRYLVRVQERPVSISAWTSMFGKAGFTDITASSIVAEAGLVSGRKPETGR
ncbi:MAG: class I SAM-dependent methyltransferase [Streptosporangiaceae bacterium]